MRILRFLIPILVIAGIFVWWRQPYSVKGPSSDKAFQYIIRISGEGNTSGPLPMIIALHGHGDTPDHFFDTLLKSFPLQARFIVPRGPIDYPGIGLSGRAWPSDVDGIRTYGDALADALSVLKDEYSTSGKPIALGFSGGATMAYYLASSHANAFSHIFPLAGSLPAALDGNDLPSTENTAQITAFHGMKDQVIGLNRGQAAVAMLKKRGLKAKLVTLDGGHLEVFRSANSLVLTHLGEAVSRINP